MYLVKGCPLGENDMKIKFPLTKILYLEAGYWGNSSVEARKNEEHIEQELALAVRNRGYFTKPELQTLCRWKNTTH